jgi:AbrB family looped-hinge helix DNA binding protein
MLARLSSKGQLVIPKVIREALDLRAGTQFQVRVGDGKIVLEPIPESAIDVLYGKYAGADLIGELEAEHHQEIQDESTVRP